MLIFNICCVLCIKIFYGLVIIWKLLRGICFSVWGAETNGKRQKRFLTKSFIYPRRQLFQSLNITTLLF